MNIDRRPLLTALLLAACSASPTGPGSADGPLRIEAEIGNPSLAVGDTATLLIRLVNTSALSVTLNFSSSCQVLPYIRLADFDQVVYPTGGGRACADVLTQLTIPANSSHFVPLRLRGGAPELAIYPEIPIRSGRYVATAELHSTDYRLRSAPVVFSVR